jgi:hypothetical protein
VVNNSAVWLRLRRTVSVRVHSWFNAFPWLRGYRKTRRRAAGAFDEILLRIASIVRFGLSRRNSVENHEWTQIHTKKGFAFRTHGSVNETAAGIRDVFIRITMSKDRAFRTKLSNPSTTDLTDNTDKSRTIWFLIRAICVIRG